MSPGDGAKFREDETVLLRSESGLAARSVVITSLRSVNCTLDDCVNGCVGFKFTPDALILVEEAAASGFAAPAGFAEIERRDYGDTQLVFLRSA